MVIDEIDVSTTRVEAWHKKAQHWVNIVCIFLTEDGKIQSVQDTKNRIIPATDLELYIT